MFYKMIGGIPHKMVMPIKTDKGLYFGNSIEVIAKAGYKPMVCESAPVAEGFRAVPFWEETEECITQRWRLVPEHNEEAEEE